MGGLRPFSKSSSVDPFDFLGEYSTIVEQRSGWLQYAGDTSRVFSKHSGRVQVDEKACFFKWYTDPLTLNAVWKFENVLI